MKDTDFEHNSRAHSFWQEWQGAADRAGGEQCIANGAVVSLPGEIYSWGGVSFTFDTDARCSHTGNLIIDLT